MTRKSLVLGIVTVILASCGESTSSWPAKDAADKFTGGDAVAISPSVTARQELATLQAAVAAGPKTAADLLASHSVTFATTIPYSPDQALSLSTIQSSGLALSDVELSVLRDHGFVISDSKVFSSFTSGYISLYAAHLPLFVSADSVLYAIHRSYDQILEELETSILRVELAALLDSMRAQLGATSITDWGAARADADLYLAVAKSLLEDGPVAGVAGGEGSQITSLCNRAIAANGTGLVNLFGVAREIDFSQFAPRGHYPDTPMLWVLILS